MPPPTEMMLLVQAYYSAALAEQRTRSLAGAATQRKDRPMLSTKPPEIKPIDWKMVEGYKAQGFEIFQGGDADKANSETFLIMRRSYDNAVMILCPTFLRGPITITGRSIGY